MSEQKDVNVVGVDLGGTNIRSAAVDAGGSILGEDHRLTHAERSANEIIADIIASIRTALSSAGLACSQIAAIGIGSPGPLDATKGTILNPPNLPGLHNVNLVIRLENILARPVSLGNDAFCAGLGECAYGVGKNYQNDRLAGVTLGTGFGSWAKGLIPEFGHTISIDNYGELCHCGQRGCPEAYVSSYGIVRLAERRGLMITNVGELGDLLRKGSPLAEVVVREAGQYLGRVFVNIAHVCEPRMIVVSGSIVKLGTIFLESAEYEMRTRGFRDRVQNVKIVAAELGDNAGILGAAKLALDSLACGEQVESQGGGE